ncbi:MAG TPA: AI-2E family transporter [Polyangiaceae bacterium]|nr:AI-2E family transporter [Polyangiaceae bacterium]
MIDPKSTSNPYGIPSTPSGWSRGRVLFLSISGALVLALLVAVREILLPFVLAAILAYVLTPLVQLCERAKIPRSVSILTVYAVTISLIYISVAAIAPRLYTETINLARDTPALARNLATSWGPKVDAWVQGYLTLGGQRPAPPKREADLPAFQIAESPEGFSVELQGGVDLVQAGPSHWRIVRHQEQAPEGFRVRDLMNVGFERLVGFVKLNALEIIKIGQSLVSQVSRAILLVFMTLMVAGYLMHTRETVMGFFKSLPPPSAQPGFERLLWRIDRGVAGVVRGQLLICAVNGVLSAIGFWMFGLKYWPILAIIAGIMSLIPIFGSILSSVPAVLIGLTQDFWTALWVLLWILGIHQVEANLLNPKIIGVAAKIHPVLVVFALIIGEHFFGLWGALLAVPTLSLAQSIFNHFRFESMPELPPDSLLPPASRSGQLG